MAQYLRQTRDALSAVCEAYAHGDQSTLHAGTAACLRTSAFFQCRDVEEVARHFSGLMSRVRESPIRESLEGIPGISPTRKISGLKQKQEVLGTPGVRREQRLPGLCQRCAGARMHLAIFPPALPVNGADKDFELAREHWVQHRRLRAQLLSASSRASLINLFVSHLRTETGGARCASRTRQGAPTADTRNG